MKKRLLILFIPLLLVGFLIGYFSAKTFKVKNDSPAENNFHYSPITQRAYYDDFFAENLNCQNNYHQSVKGLIVNHHLLAGKLIAQTLCRVATDQSITIVLLSPNHFGNGDGHIIVSLFDWQTPDGLLQNDQASTLSLVNKKIAITEETPFNFEHGVYNIISFIKKTIPNAKVMPIIVKDSVSQTEKDDLVSFLNNDLPADSLIIASLDFSHYLFSGEADRADEQTLVVINKLDLDGLKKLNPHAQPDNVDSKAVLEIFLSAMRQQQAVDFELVAHSNSAKLIGDLSLPETTSYLVGLFSKSD